MSRRRKKNTAGETRPAAHFAERAADTPAARSPAPPADGKNPRGITLANVGRAAILAANGQHVEPALRDHPQFEALYARAEQLLATEAQLAAIHALREELRSADDEVASRADDEAYRLHAAAQRDRDRDRAARLAARTPDEDTPYRP